jgi:hypothetical protein
MTIPDRRGRPQDHVMLPLKAVPMWLSEVSVNKVEPGLLAVLLALPA